MKIGERGKVVVIVAKAKKVQMGVANFRRDLQLVQLRHTSRHEAKRVALERVRVAQGKFHQVRESGEERVHLVLGEPSENAELTQVRQRQNGCDEIVISLLLLPLLLWQTSVVADIKEDVEAGEIRKLG